MCAGVVQVVYMETTAALSGDIAPALLSAYGLFTQFPPQTAAAPVAMALIGTGEEVA